MVIFGQLRIFIEFFCGARLKISYKILIFELNVRKISDEPLAD